MSIKQVADRKTLKPKEQNHNKQTHNTYVYAVLYNLFYQNATNLN